MPLFGLSTRLSSLWQLLVFRMTESRLIMAVSAFIALTGNWAYWKAYIGISPVTSLHSVGFLMANSIFLFVAIHLLLCILAFRRLVKPMATLLLLVAAASAYFMDSYGVLLDTAMIQNVFETDVREATELLTVKLALYLLLLGVLPSLLVWRCQITTRTLVKELSWRLVMILVSLASLGLSIAAFYKDFSITGREHKELRMMINPTYPLYAFSYYVSGASKKSKTKVTPIGEDARQSAQRQQQSRRSLVVLVLGETARAQQFSLNGYTRDTNPELSQRPIINFTDTWSCGTATAESVPCMFSVFDRENYTVKKARGQEGVLDVLKHAGIDVLWRDNNSGCKEVCSRVAYEDLSNLKLADLCNKEECYDEVLLEGLQKYIDALSANALIVLHQKGSHGPAYYKRTPENAKVFKPECTEANVQNCSQESIVNAYDNTIRYTDHVLALLIDLLQKNAETRDTALIYMSDHGESLGENGVYLHGFPYILAPEEQKHVPFVAWFSAPFSEHQHLDVNCVGEHRKEHYSHDNLFDTLLGLFDVETSVYRADHDIFRRCRN